jgi:hypothetical protein
LSSNTAELAMSKQEVEEEGEEAGEEADEEDDY